MKMALVMMMMMKMTADLEAGADKAPRRCFVSFILSQTEPNNGIDKKVYSDSQRIRKELNCDLSSYEMAKTCSA